MLREIDVNALYFQIGGATDIVTNDSVFDVALASITQQRVKLNPFCVEDQADLLQDIKLLAKEENL